MQSEMTLYKKSWQKTSKLVLLDECVIYAILRHAIENKI